MNKVIPLISKFIWAMRLILSSIAPRFFLVMIFILSSVGQTQNFLAVKIYMAINGIPSPEILLIFTIVCNILSGLLVIAGYKTKWATIALIAFIIPTTLLFHTELSNAKEALDFMRNVSILGGLLLLVQHGAGYYSIDAYLERRKAKKASIQNPVEQSDAKLS
jgi:putative oxidoreductase